MAHAQRNDVDHGGHPLVPQPDARRYDAGGHVAQLQADLARRLIEQRVAGAPALPDTPAERLVRFCSAAGGYGALLAGYAATALAIAHWL